MQKALGHFTSGINGGSSPSARRNANTTPGTPGTPGYDQAIMKSDIRACIDDCLDSGYVDARVSLLFNNYYSKENNSGSTNTSEFLSAIVKETFILTLINSVDIANRANEASANNTHPSRAMHMGINTGGPQTILLSGGGGGGGGPAILSKLSSGLKPLPSELGTPSPDGKGGIVYISPNDAGAASIIYSIDRDRDSRRKDIVCDDSDDSDDSGDSEAYDNADAYGGGIENDIDGGEDTDEGLVNIRMDCSVRISSNNLLSSNLNQHASEGSAAGPDNNESKSTIFYSSTAYDLVQRLTDDSKPEYEYGDTVLERSIVSDSTRLDSTCSSNVPDLADDLLLHNDILRTRSKNELSSNDGINAQNQSRNGGLSENKKHNWMNRPSKLGTISIENLVKDYHGSFDRTSYAGESYLDHASPSLLVTSISDKTTSTRFRDNRQGRTFQSDYNNNGSNNNNNSNSIHAIGLRDSLGYGNVNESDANPPGGYNSGSDIPSSDCSDANDDDNYNNNTSSNNNNYNNNIIPSNHVYCSDDEFGVGQDINDYDNSNVEELWDNALVSNLYEEDDGAASDNSGPVSGSGDKALSNAFSSNNIFDTLRENIQNNYSPPRPFSLKDVGPEDFIFSDLTASNSKKTRMRSHKNRISAPQSHSDSIEAISSSVNGDNGVLPIDGLGVHTYSDLFEKLSRDASRKDRKKSAKKKRSKKAKTVGQQSADSQNSREVSASASSSSSSGVKNIIFDDRRNGSDEHFIIPTSPAAKSNNTRDTSDYKLPTTHSPKPPGTPSLSRQYLYGIYDDKTDDGDGGGNMVGRKSTTPSSPPSLFDTSRLTLPHPPSPPIIINSSAKIDRNEGNLNNNDDGQDEEENGDIPDYEGVLNQSTHSIVEFVVLDTAANIVQMLSSNVATTSWTADALENLVHLVIVHLNVFEKIDLSDGRKSPLKADVFSEGGRGRQLASDMMKELRGYFGREMSHDVSIEIIGILDNFLSSLKRFRVKSSLPIDDSSSCDSNSSSRSDDMSDDSSDSGYDENDEGGVSDSSSSSGISLSSRGSSGSSTLEPLTPLGEDTDNFDGHFNSISGPPPSSPHPQTSLLSSSSSPSSPSGAVSSFKPSSAVKPWTWTDYPLKSSPTSNIDNDNKSRNKPVAANAISISTTSAHSSTTTSEFNMVDNFHQVASSGSASPAAANSTTKFLSPSRDKQFDDNFDGFINLASNDSNENFGEYITIDDLPDEHFPNTMGGGRGEGDGGSTLETFANSSSYYDNSSTYKSSPALTPGESPRSTSISDSNSFNNSNSNSNSNSNDTSPRGSYNNDNSNARGSISNFLNSLKSDQDMNAADCNFDGPTIDAIISSLLESEPDLKELDEPFPLMFNSSSPKGSSSSSSNSSRNNNSNNSNSSEDIVSFLKNLAMSSELDSRLRGSSAHTRSNSGASTSAAGFPSALSGNIPSSYPHESIDAVFRPSSYSIGVGIGTSSSGGGGSFDRGGYGEVGEGGSYNLLKFVSNPELPVPPLTSNAEFDAQTFENFKLHLKQYSNSNSTRDDDGGLAGAWATTQTYPSANNDNYKDNDDDDDDDAIEGEEDNDDEEEEEEGIEWQDLSPKRASSETAVREAFLKSFNDSNDLFRGDNVDTFPLTSSPSSLSNRGSSSLKEDGSPSQLHKHGIGLSRSPEASSSAPTSASISNFTTSPNSNSISNSNIISDSPKRSSPDKRSSVSSDLPYSPSQISELYHIRHLQQQQQQQQQRQHRRSSNRTTELPSFYNPYPLTNSNDGSGGSSGSGEEEVEVVFDDEEVASIDYAVDGDSFGREDDDDDDDGEIDFGNSATDVNNDDDEEYRDSEAIYQFLAHHQLQQQQNILNPQVKDSRLPIAVSRDRPDSFTDSRRAVTSAVYNTEALTSSVNRRSVTATAVGGSGYVIAGNKHSKDKDKVKSRKISDGGSSISYDKGILSVLSAKRSDLSDFYQPSSISAKEREKVYGIGSRAGVHTSSSTTTTYNDYSSNSSSGAVGMHDRRGERRTSRVRTSGTKTWSPGAGSRIARSEHSSISSSNIGGNKNKNKKSDSYSQNNSHRKSDINNNSISHYNISRSATTGVSSAKLKSQAAFEDEIFMKKMKSILSRK